MRQTHPIGPSCFYRIHSGLSVFILLLGLVSSFFDKTMDELILFILIIFLLLFDRRIRGCREGVQEFFKLCYLPS
ncbi:hypothetical protein BDV32DRAFT_77453 [Aspergillus pseudonomiae]|nr:hypothetical protein BDV32DRAFT_77453 [Aspergillus pseudonomiae]